MKENENNQATDEISYLEFAGRKFPDTPEGRAQLKGYGEALSHLVGRQSNEVGEARQKLAKYQRIESQLPEPVKMILESEEASQDAKLLAQFMYSEKLKEAQKDDSSRRDQWYHQATEKVFETLPELKETYDEDIIDALLRKHTLHESEDPLGEALKILTPKVRKPKASAAEPKEESKAVVSVDASSPRPSGMAAKEEKKEDKPLGDIDSYFFSAIGAK